MVWLGLARAALLTIPFRWTTRLFALEAGEEQASPGETSREAAERIGWALRTAAGRVPWQSTCLTQALAGCGMLRRRGIPATMSMGVAKASHAADGIEAHAWLSCAGVVLTGAGTHERFQVVARFTGAPPRRPSALGER
jgi:hypothetical protein